MKTVAQLRQENYKVRVVHARFVTRRKKLTLKEIREQYGDLRNVLARGGSTEITIDSPDGKTGRGLAVCIKDDAFNRKVGLSLALEAALKDLK